MATPGPTDFSLGDALQLLRTKCLDYHRRYESIFASMQFDLALPFKDYVECIVNDPKEWLLTFPANDVSQPALAKSKTAMMYLLSHDDVRAALSPSFCKDAVEVLTQAWLAHKGEVLRWRSRSKNDGNSSSRGGRNKTPNKEARANRIVATSEADSNSVDQNLLDAEDDAEDEDVHEDDDDDDVQDDADKDDDHDDTHDDDDEDEDEDEDDEDEDEDDENEYDYQLDDLSNRVKALEIAAARGRCGLGLGRRQQGREQGREKRRDRIINVDAERFKAFVTALPMDPRVASYLGMFIDSIA